MNYPLISAANNNTWYYVYFCIMHAWNHKKKKKITKITFLFFPLKVDPFLEGRAIKLDSNHLSPPISLPRPPPPLSPNQKSIHSP